LSVLNGYWERQAGHDDAKDLSVEAYQHYWNTYGPSPDEGSYDDKLNTLAGGLVGGVIEEHRYLAIALGDGDDKAGQLYKNLIKDKLDEQGPPLNLERAKREVNEDLLDRVGNAAANTDVDAGDLVNVFEGYWERNAGEETAGELADKAYREFAL